MPAFCSRPMSATAGRAGTTNAHQPAALYEAFEPAVARTLIERLEIHHTPKNGDKQTV
ncbi:MAG: hypothetical protein WAW42_02345 [Candidatus Competibacteraceae bacterium]